MSNAVQLPEDAFEALPDISWGRIIGKPSRALASLECRMADERLYYHDWNHVERLIEHARYTFGYEYDPDLEAAILYHDSVYDEHPNKEYRSILYFQSHFPEIATIAPPPGLNETKVCKLIESTIDHIVQDDERMICLDLADLTDPERRFRNFCLIWQESVQLYNISNHSFASNCIEFMRDFRTRMEQNRDSGLVSDPDFWTKVIEGVDDNIELAEQVLKNPL